MIEREITESILGSKAYTSGNQRNQPRNKKHKQSFTARTACNAVNLCVHCYHNSISELLYQWQLRRIQGLQELFCSQINKTSTAGLPVMDSSAAPSQWSSLAFRSCRRQWPKAGSKPLQVPGASGGSYPSYPPSSRHCSVSSDCASGANRDKNSLWWVIHLGEDWPRQGGHLVIYWFNHSYQLEILVGQTNKWWLTMVNKKPQKYS